MLLALEFRAPNLAIARVTMLRSRGHGKHNSGNDRFLAYVVNMDLQVDLCSLSTAFQPDRVGCHCCCWTWGEKKPEQAID